MGSHSHLLCLGHSITMAPMLLLFSLVLGLANSQTTSTPMNFLELYTQVGGAGAKATVTDYNHDLADIGFDDLVQSVCGQGGWILYEHTEYNSSHGHRGWSEVFSAGTYDCHDLPETRHGQWSWLSWNRHLRPT